MANTIYEQTVGEFLISTDKGLLNIAMIHHFLSKESYWAKDIPGYIVNNAVFNSMCFGIYINKEQIGFARVVSDYATFAYFADVFIVNEHRGKGLSKQLMAFMLKHPQLQHLRRYCLGTKDAHKLYEQFGFKKMDNPENWMEIKHNDIYSNQTV